VVLKRNSQLFFSADFSPVSAVSCHIILRCFFLRRVAIAGSRKVLATAVDDGQENLIALAPSTSLRLRPRTIMRGGQRAVPMN
jgi:hypothetical protein